MARIVTLGLQKVELPKGVEIARDRVRIGFGWRGRHWYETLPGQANAKTVERAGIKVAAIRLEIEEGRFDYRRHFPDSKNALKATTGRQDVNPRATVGEMLDEEAAIAKEKKAPSTARSELTWHRFIRDYFGEHRQVRYINEEDAEDFVRHLRGTLTAKGTPLSPKSISNIMMPFRAILKRAHMRHILTHSVHDRFVAPKGKELRPKREKMPLTRDELDAFSVVDHRPIDRDMFVFNCWTGLSVSELTALAWEDVDTNGEVWTLTIRRAYAERVWKVPKTEQRERTIELNRRAQVLLQAQRARTRLQRPITVDVLDRENLHTERQQIRPVFRNSETGTIWNSQGMGRCFHTLCKKAGIPLRGPNQTRHTFASMMLTAGLPLPVLVQLMGHSNEMMLRRHYADWLDQDVGGRVAQAMNEVIEKI